MPETAARPSHRDPKIARLIAVITGVIGAILAIATPLLPVTQDVTSISWPSSDMNSSNFGSVDTPLVSYAPLEFDATIPCAAVEQLGPDGGTLVSTAPVAAGNTEARGLVARVDDGRLQVILRERVLTEVDVADLDPGCTLTISSNAERTTSTLASDTSPRDTVTAEGDVRPQVVGIFTDLDSDVDGLDVAVNVDSRFSSSPTAFKLTAMLVGALATITALLALHRLDDTDGRRARRFLPARWWKFTAVDIVVVAVLGLWHFIGANTSDDGYLLTMARASEQAGYMANYFRWFGVPEAPFGMPYYDMLAALTTVSTASIWMRLPATLAAIACWMIISREVIPRLGRAVVTNRVALWTAALVFLAFWLPYNNGLRPEPVIALGALLTWCSIERAIATGRLLPAAIAIIVAAFSLAAGPTGLIAVAALLAGSRPLVMIVIKRSREVGFAALLAPLVASGTAVLIAVFADQTLRSVLEATRVRAALGPNVPWFEERIRWDALMTVAPDGSLARRFGVFMMILCVAVCIAVMLRKQGRIPGTAVGPSRRILGIVVGALALMMFTPTKWTHHFGVYAGLAGSVAALAAVSVTAATIRSPRNRTLFTAAVLFLTAVAFTSSNGWWYVSSYGIPWFDKPPSIAGLGFSTILLGLTALTLIYAGYQHIRMPYRDNDIEPRQRGLAGQLRRRFAPSALTLVAGGVVVFEVLSFVKGAVDQYPAYSIGRSNTAALTGNSCGLANDVLVETDVNASMLQPVEPGPDPLGGGSNTGFTPDGVASDLTADSEDTAQGSANSISPADSPASAGATSSNSAGTAGGTAENVGINGSSAALPFGLDPQTTPVLGSFGATEPAALTSGWYALPGAESAPRNGLIAIAAAGRIRSVDSDGIVTPGQSLEVEYGVREGADSAVRILGRLTPADIGPAPSWRNLRVPLRDLPSDADVVRIVASDDDLAGDQWLAVTPPRVPQTTTLNALVGSQDPVLLDWAVGLAFPCQRPFDHRDGIAEVPRFRILPDRTGAESTNAWQDSVGGGPLGWTELLVSAQTLPSYLVDDYDRDWGSIERFTPLVPGTATADVTVERRSQSGLSSAGPMKTD